MNEKKSGKPTYLQFDTKIPIKDSQHMALKYRKSPFKRVLNEDFE